MLQVTQIIFIHGKNIVEAAEVIGTHLTGPQAVKIIATPGPGLTRPVIGFMPDMPVAGTGRIHLDTMNKARCTHALGELRQIIADLRPPILDDMGLAAALKWYVQGFEGRRGVRDVFILDGEPLRLPSEFETVLFRIAQESLTNVAKHAAASTVTVMLRFAPGTVCLLVEDDGQGFDTHGSRFGGWGLLGMQERASLLGGQCVIDSTPKVGTRVWTTAPLPAPMLEMDNDTSETVVG